jgi:hypothetical protein
VGEGLADLTESYNRIAHIFSLGLPRPTGSEYRVERPAGRSALDLR